MPHASRPTSDRHLFVAFCLLIVWAPIPLGSNRVWAMQLLQAWVALISAGLCWQVARGQLELAPALRKAWLPTAMLSGIVLWTLIQILPQPLSPLDPYTRNLTSGYLALQKGIAYSLFFLCACIRWPCRSCSIAGRRAKLCGRWPPRRAGRSST